MSTKMENGRPRLCLRAGAMAAGLWFSAQVVMAPCALADPGPELPTDPEVPMLVAAQPADVLPPPSTIRGPLAQNGIPGGPGGAPDLSRDGNDFLLGQAPVPSAPGTVVGMPPSLNAMTNTYLLEQNVVPSAPGEGTVFGVPPGQENSVVRGRDYLRRLHATYKDGGLLGSLLGQRPQVQLGEPLPGTDPLPGLQIPPGLTPPETGAPGSPAAKPPSDQPASAPWLPEGGPA